MRRVLSWHLPELERWISDQYNKEKRGTMFRSSTDEIFETLTGNNKIG